MARLVVYQGIKSDPFAAVIHLENLLVLAEADAEASTNTAAVFWNQTTRYTVRGSDLSLGEADGGTFLTGGTVEDIEIWFGPGYYMTLSQLGLDVAGLLALRGEERADALSDAVETWFNAQDWSFNGNAAGESVPSSRTSNDGHLLRLAGDDQLRLGHVADLGEGGGGDDRIFGGGGTDTLRGQQGNDRLFGDRHADILEGGAGHDVLFGGGHNDQLSGGSGRDRLGGGGGADVFRMELGSGTDVVTDFDASEDRLWFEAEGEASIEEQDGRVLVTVGAETLILLDTTADQIVPGVFL